MMLVRCGPRRSPVTAAPSIVPALRKPLITSMVPPFAKLLIATAVTCALLAPAWSEAQRGRPATAPPGGQDEKWICAGANGQRDTIGKPNTGIPFNDQTALRVEIEDPSRIVPPASWPAILDLARTAVGTWRWACQSCPTANLGLLEIHGDLYMLPVLERALQFANKDTRWLEGYNLAPQPAPGQPATVGPGGLLRSPTTIDGFDSQENVVWLGWLGLQLNLAAGGRHGTSEPHVRVADREALANHTCSLPRDRLPDFVQRVQDALGCRETLRPRQLRARPLHILVVPGHTSCGLSKNIIGCEADGALVELNAKDYSFTAAGPNGQVLFGEGGVRIDLLHVALHELGHWIGLPHLTDADDIMASSLDKSKCITTATMTELRQLLGGPWKPGAKQAFQYQDPASLGADKGGAR